MTYGFFAYLHPEKLIRYPEDEIVNKEANQSLDYEQYSTTGIEIASDQQNKTILPFPISSTNNTMDIFMNNSEPTTMELVATDSSDVEEDSKKNTSKGDGKHFQNLKNFMSNEGLESKQKSV